ncbi:MAG: BMP family protein [Firmicutes bacterium]|nr:BMP family protein [Bacillota bacterium]
MKARLIAAFALLFLSVSALPMTAATPLKVALVMPGVITDQVWNQNGYEGLLAIKDKLGAQIAYTERVPQPEQAQALADYARRGFDIVIGHGGEFDAAVNQVASRFPKTEFVVTNGTATGPNVASLAINHWQVAYMAGTVAGLMTKTGELAIITGQEFQAVRDMIDGFTAGAQAAKSSNKVVVSYTGGWDDIGKAKEAALAHIADGADVLYPMLDMAFIGVIEAAREKKVWSMGFQRDHLDLAPDTLLTSALEDVGHAMVWFVKTVAEGKFEGKHYWVGVEEPAAAGLGRFGAMVPEKVRQQAEKVRQAILAGTMARSK